METDAGETVDITSSLDGRMAAAYLSAARRRGWPDRRILDEIGGWEAVKNGRVEGYDGIVRWAVGAEIRDGDLVLYEPDFGGVLPWSAVTA